MSQTAAEERAERVAKRLHDRQPQDSIPRLLLQILAEELKIHRLHMEERLLQARQESHDANTARGRENRQQTRNPPPQNQNANSRHEEHRPPMMPGGAGPPETGAHEKHARKGQQHRHRSRSSSLGPPPTYQRRLGVTMGFASHIRECIDYEKRRLEKEARRKQRSARRGRKDYAGKSGRHDESRHGRVPREIKEENPERGGGVEGRNHPSRRGSDEYGSETAWEHSEQRLLDSPIAYEQNEHALSVEELEREQAGNITRQSKHRKVRSKGEGYVYHSQPGDRLGNGASIHNEPSWGFDGLPRRNSG